MTHTRTIWEEGREPGSRVVALGVALALTVAVVDDLMAGRIEFLFDLCFVLICVGVALLVRPSDFFSVGVLPPLLMAGIFVLFAVSRPTSLTGQSDGFLQAIVSGLGRHSVALFIGYALSLGCLAQRRRWATRH